MRKIKSGIAYVSVLLFFSNCNDDTFENLQEVSATTKLLSGIKEENISLDEIEKDYYLSPILQKTSNKLKQNSNNLKNTTQNLFNLDLSNRVKKYTLNDYTSYTIPIINDSGNSYIFQNLVIEKDALRDAAYLVTYYPDENYKESIRKHLVKPDDNIDFTGSKTIEYLYYKRKVNIDKKNTTTSKGIIEIGSDGVIDKPLTICVTTYSPKQCTAGGNHSPGESCTGTSGQQPGWIVSESCTPVLIPRPTNPGPGSYPGSCTGCVTAPSTPNQGTGAYFPPTSPSPDWTPEFICIEKGSEGKCTKMVPYTPILTVPMYDPYNYYTTVLSREEIDLLLRAEYHEARKSIDFYIERNKTLEGGYVPETRTFVPWALDYFKNHPKTTFEQFENWFMGESEGSDGGVQFDINDYYGIEVIKQDLPERNTFYDAFPKLGASAMPSSKVYELVGGHMWDAHKVNDPNYQNACAIRISRGLNYSGKPIPVFKNKSGIQKSEKGKDGLNYILDASSLLAYMLKSYSDNPPLHLINKSPTEYLNALKGKWGIYIMLPKSSRSFGASGHADFFSQTGCLSGCYFSDAAEIYFWELK